MSLHNHGWLPLLAVLVLLVASAPSFQANRVVIENGVKTSVFLSPKIELNPGSVSDKYFYGIDFPRGHIALKSFNGEVVDEDGNSIPLHETYLHHWVAVRFYQRESVNGSKHNDKAGFHKPDRIMAGNSGLCEHTLTQFFGLGSETRKTATHIPDPYALEFGNPSEIPEGYEEKWMLNVHAIDTRGVEDKLGCTECRCDLYNVTADEYGRPLNTNYVGGLKCCYDATQCRTRVGINHVKRSIYVRYTVKWVDWDSSIVPVKAYILDVTDTWKRVDERTGLSTTHDCKVEYDVAESCSTREHGTCCTDTRRVSLGMPNGGIVVYGVAHQHTGGVGSALYGEDGRLICSSMPTYGEGEEVGNEAGYIVGMSTCYPQPGSVKIMDGEVLTLESNYSSSRRHTGVMGLFYLLVAKDSSKFDSHLHSPVEIYEKAVVPKFVWGGLVLFAVAIGIAVFAYQRRSQRGEEYQPIAM